MVWHDITGTVADWVMAGSAAYAAINAKQWFSQRSHTKGFDKAEELLSNIDNLYQTTYKSIEQLHTTLDYLNMIGSGLKISDVSDAKKYEALEDSHSVKIIKIDKIVEELELIERWSIEVKNKEIILATTKSIRDVNVSAVNYYISVKSNIYYINGEGKRGLQQSIGNYKLLYSEYLSDLVALETAYKKFKKQKFVTFFKAK